MVWNIFYNLRMIIYYSELCIWTHSMAINSLKCSSPAVSQGLRCFFADAIVLKVSNNTRAPVCLSIIPQTVKSQVDLYKHNSTSKVE